MELRRIAIMTAWNVDSGVFMHAEPIVKTWIDMGYEVRVFTFIKEDFHGTVIIGEDEPYVTRCFGTSVKTNFLDPRPFLLEDYDIFVVEDLKMLPMKNLALIFPIIKRKAKVVVHIMHESTIYGDPPPQPPEFYAFDWDAVVYIEKTQEWFIKKIYGDKAHYIPFPCYPERRGDKEECRKKLGLPLDKKLVLVYARGGYMPYLPALPDKDLEDTYFLVITNKDFKWKYPQTEIRKTGPLTNQELDEYAFASDAIILHKIMAPPFPTAVTSTAVYQFIGTLRPLLVPKISESFEPFNGEVLKYTNRAELKELLVDALNMGERTREALEKARNFVKERDPKKIARMFIDLFEKLISEKNIA